MPLQQHSVILASEIAAQTFKTIDSGNIIYTTHATREGGVQKGKLIEVEDFPMPHTYVIRNGIVQQDFKFYPGTYRVEGQGHMPGPVARKGQKIDFTTNNTDAAEFRMNDSDHGIMSGYCTESKIDFSTINSIEFDFTSYSYNAIFFCFSLFQQQSREYLDQWGWYYATEYWDNTSEGDFQYHDAFVLKKESSISSPIIINRNDVINYTEHSEHHYNRHSTLNEYLNAYNQQAYLCIGAAIDHHSPSDDHQFLGYNDFIMTFNNIILKK